MQREVTGKTKNTPPEKRKMVTISTNGAVEMAVVTLIAFACIGASAAGDGGSQGDTIELLHVYGCAATSTPRRTTSSCRLDGKDTITIRGRNFEFDSEITLSQSVSLIAVKPAAGGAAGGLPKNRVTLRCALKHHSRHLPHQLMFCQLPALTKDPELEAQLALASNGGPPTFDLHVANIATGQSTVLRRAVAFMQPSLGGSKQASGGAGQKDGDSIEGVAEQIFSSLDGDFWISLGVGGLKKQFSELFRRAFASRLGGIGEMVVNAGLPHVKGVILHGPPGTGKTLIARTIAKLLHATNVQVVNGPEIINKFVGESEKNLRALFDAAEQDFKKNKEAAGLHVLIFDEIDVLLRHRGKGGDEKGVYDGVTTQMLALMDGVNSCPNVLIIGLTNRLDALDKALLRPGRFEVQIRIPLPDDEGRQQIFSIHTKNLKAHRYLSPAVDFNALSRDTTSFSGADIAGVVRSATSFALERMIAKRSSNSVEKDSLDPDESSAGSSSPVSPACSESGTPAAASVCTGSAEDYSHLSSEGGGVEQSPFFVLHDDFVRGIREVIETKGSAANVVPFLSRGGVARLPGDRLRALSQIQQLVGDLRKSTTLRRLRVLLHGASGSGTTTLAALAARESRYSYVHIITAESLSGLTAEEKIQRITDTFATASHVPLSFIVLDGIENIADATFGRHANDRLLTEVLSILYHDPSLVPRNVPNSKVFVLVTTSSDETAQQLVGSSSSSTSASQRLVDRVVKIANHVPALDVFLEYNCFGVNNRPLSAKMAGYVAQHVSLKRLLFFIEVARARAGITQVKLAPLQDAANAPASWREPSAELLEAAAIPEHIFVEVLQEFGALDSAGSSSSKGKSTIGGRSPSL